MPETPEALIEAIRKGHIRLVSYTPGLTAKEAKERLIEALETSS